MHSLKQVVEEQRKPALVSAIAQLEKSPLNLVFIVHSVCFQYNTLL